MIGILKNQKTKYLIVLFLAIAMVFAFPQSTRADEEEEESSELTTEEALEEAKAKAESARSEKQEMLDELEAKQQNLDEINLEIIDLQGSINSKQAEIDNMTDRINLMKRSINEQKGGLGNRLRNMYKSGSVGMFDILLDSNSFSEFLSNIGLIQRIYDNDQKTLEELEETHDVMEVILTDMETVKKGLDDEMSWLEAREAEAEKAKEEVETLLEEIQAKIEEYDAEAERLSEVLAEEQAEIMRQLAAAQATDEIYMYFTGSSDAGFAWPCYGPLTSFFGYRDDVPVGSTNHGGIDIGVDYYVPIYASRSGYVSSATGWSGGYGYAVYLIHDEGFSTVYGHNSELLVSPGEYVEQGQIIAYAGSTGWSTGPHCHFEIRYGGVQVDPLDYLP